MVAKRLTRNQLQPCVSARPSDWMAHYFVFSLVHLACATYSSRVRSFDGDNHLLRIAKGTVTEMERLVGSLFSKLPVFLFIFSVVGNYPGHSACRELRVENCFARREVMAARFENVSQSKTSRFTRIFISAVFSFPKVNKI